MGFIATGKPLLMSRRRDCSRFRLLSPPAAVGVLKAGPLALRTATLSCRGAWMHEQRSQLPARAKPHCEPTEALLSKAGNPHPAGHPAFSLQGTGRAEDRALEVLTRERPRADPERWRVPGDTCPPSAGKGADCCTEGSC